MEETLAAVRAVDADTYFYGEGWPPAAGTADAAFELADQDSMAGTGIGTFNDRLRDRLRALSISAGGDLARVRAGLAGNLAKFQLVLDSGVTIVAANDGGYTADPQESVNYASVHDGMTLWDQLNQGGVLPDAEAATAARVRMAVQAHSLVLLSQGVPFVHMGADLLRSKSLSRNSYKRRGLVQLRGLHRAEQQLERRPAAGGAERRRRAGRNRRCQRGARRRGHRHRQGEVQRIPPDRPGQSAVQPRHR